MRGTTARQWSGHWPTWAVALALICSACSTDKDAISGLSSDRAAEMNFERAVPEGAQGSLTPATHLAAGRLSEVQGALAQAVDQYQQALRIDPKYLPALYRMGVIYTQIKQYQEAVIVWQRYRDAAGADATSLGNLAFCYDLAGMTNAAMSTYEQALAKDPKNVGCRVNYGLLLARSGRADDALTQWKMVLPPAQAHYNLGACYEQLGQADEARAEYANALAADGGFVAAKERLDALKLNE